MAFFSRIQRMASANDVNTTNIEVMAPISGQLVTLENVPDAVFAEKIVGDGIAIYPTGDTLYAPISGTLAKIFDNNHAFSIENQQGIELFVHFGVGTVELGGKGFTRLKEEGNQVTVGEAIISVELDLVRDQVDSILTPIVIANMEDINSITCSAGHVTAAKDVIFNVNV